jgi:hypothetical protein
VLPRLYIEEIVAQLDQAITRQDFLSKCSLRLRKRETWTTMDKLQTPKEISALLRISESTVLRMAYSGDLPYIP